MAERESRTQFLTPKYSFYSPPHSQLSLLVPGALLLLEKGETRIDSPDPPGTLTAIQAAHPRLEASGPTPGSATPLSTWVPEQVGWRAGDLRPLKGRHGWKA